MIEVLHSVGDVRNWRADHRAAGRAVALVPTMGALHAGHLSLIERARTESDITLVSVFVNPTQFGPDEDYDGYPRDLKRDLEQAAGVGVAAVFAPSRREIYPVEPTVWVDPGELATRLCGASRPGHFRGVLTMVNKLLAIAQPDTAVFGRKDFQQSVLVQRMVEEFRLSVRIVVAPTVRESDGLALSSRNEYLSADERDTARALVSGLRAGRAAFREGETDPVRLEAMVGDRMVEAGLDVEYARVVEPKGLEAPERAASTDVLAVAGRVGGTRLIDNETLGGPSPID